MRNRVVIAGVIRKDGSLGMYMEELKELCQNNKGRRIVATFKVVGDEPSNAFRGYYFNGVVRQFQDAFRESGERLDEKETERRLREISPIMQEYEINEDTGDYIHRLRSIAEIDTTDLIEHIEFLKEYASVNYDLYIEDPEDFYSGSK